MELCDGRSFIQSVIHSVIQSFIHTVIHSPIVFFMVFAPPRPSKTALGGPDVPSWSHLGAI